MRKRPQVKSGSAKSIEKFCLRFLIAFAILPLIVLLGWANAHLDSANFYPIHRMLMEDLENDAYNPMCLGSNDIHFCSV